MSQSDSTAGGRVKHSPHRIETTASDTPQLSPTVEDLIKRLHHVAEHYNEYSATWIVKILTMAADALSEIAKLRKEKP